jgi:hypothetical protein
VLSKCQAVTVSINPAENQEGYRSLPRLSDYGLADRSALADGDLADIARQNDEYFVGGNKHRFFNTLASLVSSIDSTWSYEAGTLSHIDVVACVTRPTWTNGVPGQERDFMEERCRQHFFKTLRLLPPECWLLCDGRTAIDAIEDAGGQTRTTVRLKSGLIVCIGDMEIQGCTHNYLGWNRPAHRLYERPAVLASAAKRLMNGDSDQSSTGASPTPSHGSSTILTNGHVFANQRDLMRFLVAKLGRIEDAVCREYAAAERRGLVPRSRNNHGLSAEQYAHRLYSDGIRKQWL